MIQTMTIMPITMIIINTAKKRSIWFEREPPFEPPSEEIVIVPVSLAVPSP
jgi:hypothetical protein